MVYARAAMQLSAKECAIGVTRQKGAGCSERRGLRPMVGSDKVRTMVRKTTDAVLADLEHIGAVGGSPAGPDSPVQVAAQVMAQEVPVVDVRDLQGEKAVEAIERAQVWLQEAAQALQEASNALGGLRGVRAPVERDGPPDTPEPPAEPLAEEPAEPPEEREALPLPSPSEIAQDTAVDEAYRRAREAALRKIRGEDTQSEQGDEDDVPFVGQIRACPESWGTGEVSLGAVGVVKPSPPVEG